jgi:hypothetical protein
VIHGMGNACSRQFGQVRQPVDHTGDPRPRWGHSSEGRRDLACAPEHPGPHRHPQAAARGQERHLPTATMSSVAWAATTWSCPWQRTTPLAAAGPRHGVLRGSQCRNPAEPRGQHPAEHRRRTRHRDRLRARHRRHPAPTGSPAAKPPTRCSAPAGETSSRAREARTASSAARAGTPATAAAARTGRRAAR